MSDLVKAGMTMTPLDADRIASKICHDADDHNMSPHFAIQVQVMLAYNVGLEAAAAYCEKWIRGEDVHDNIRAMKIGDGDALEKVAAHDSAAKDAAEQAHKVAAEWGEDYSLPDADVAEIAAELTHIITAALVARDARPTKNDETVARAICHELAERAYGCEINCASPGETGLGVPLCICAEDASRKIAAALATKGQDERRRAVEIAWEIERKQESDHGAANTGGAAEAAAAIEGQS